jgi:hypothetical protein
MIQKDLGIPVIIIIMLAQKGIYGIMLCGYFILNFIISGTIG